MAHRQITVCEDETFHPQICLVALEPVSNFVLREQYAANRQAGTWTQALRAALVGLKVTVIQGTGDEATALCRHVEVELAAHHSPDLFHGQHEVSKATSLSLARQVRQAAAAPAGPKSASSGCPTITMKRRGRQEWGVVDSSVMAWVLGCEWKSMLTCRNGR